MKFVVSSTGLLSHLQSISRVIASKNALPILDDFLFRVEGNTLTMKASDIETTLVTSMEIENQEGNGTIAFPSKILLETLGGFPEQPLTFVVNDDNLSLEIVSQYGKYNLMGHNGDEYPELPQVDAADGALVLPVGTLARAINCTIFATGDDELRPVMNGVYFDIAENNLTVVASDAHKLVRYKTTDVKSEKEASFILPKKPATMLKNILPKEQGEASIKFDDKNAVFTLENYTMICRLVDGRYPKYNDVIPRNNPNKAIVDRQTLINSLKRVALYSNQASNLVKLKLEENLISVSAQDIDFSFSSEEKHACQYQNEPISIGFKSSYLVEILSSIEHQEVVIELSDSRRAGVFLPLENEESEELLMLLMPIMLNE